MCGDDGEDLEVEPEEEAFNGLRQSWWDRILQEPRIREWFLPLSHIMVSANLIKWS